MAFSGWAISFAQDRATAESPFFHLFLLFLFILGVKLATNITKNKEIKNEIEPNIKKSHPNDMPKIPVNLEHLRQKLTDDDNLRKATSNLIEINRRKIFNDTISPAIGINNSFDNEIYPRIEKERFLSIMKDQKYLYDVKKMSDSTGEMNFIIGSTKLTLPNFFFTNNNFNKSDYHEDVIIVSGFQNDIKSGVEMLTFQSIRFKSFESIGTYFAFILNYLPFDADRALLQKLRSNSNMIQT